MDQYESLAAEAVAGWFPEHRAYANAPYIKQYACDLRKAAQDAAAAERARALQIIDWFIERAKAGIVTAPDRDTLRVLNHHYQAYDMVRDRLNDTTPQDAAGKEE